MAVGPLIVSNKTSQVVDFTESYLSLRSSALIRKRDSDERVSNAHDLLSSDLSYGVVEHSEAQHMLATSSESAVRAMWTRMTNFWPSAFVYNAEEGIDRARRERYAFVIDTPIAEYKASRKPCDLYTTEPFLDIMQYAFVMNKDNIRLRHVIDRELRRMKNMGEIQTTYLRWWRDDCSRSQVRSPTANRKSVHQRTTPAKSYPRLATASLNDRQNSSGFLPMTSLSYYFRFLTVCVSLRSLIQLMS